MRNLVELYSIIIDGNMVLVSSDIKTRELFFYTNQNGVLLPIDDSLRKKVEETILQSDFTPSSEFKTLLDGAINNYRKYNSSNGYSNVNLEANLKHVTYYCEKDDTSRPEASYDVFNNSFRFILPEQYWNLAGFSSYLNSQYLNLIISHEIGHMSVSDISIDSDNNYVARVGFSQMKIPVKQSFATSDGNNYYMIDKSKEIEENGGKGLEELFNELETDIATNNKVAPDFAFRLDTITNSKLRYARRSHSLEDYYRCMMGIIPLREQAQVLLKAIDLYYSAIGKQEKEKSNAMNDLIEQLLTMYEMENMKNDIPKQSHSEQESPDDGQR